MAIDGVHNTYRVPFIKKESMPENDQKKKEQKKSNKEKKDEHEKQKNEKGKIDIRV